MQVGLAALDFFHLQETKNTYETLISFYFFLPLVLEQRLQGPLLPLASFLGLELWGGGVPGDNSLEGPPSLPLPPTLSPLISLSLDQLPNTQPLICMTRMLSSESLQFLSDGCRSFQTSSQLSSQSPAGSTSLNH